MTNFVPVTRHKDLFLDEYPPILVPPSVDKVKNIKLGNSNEPLVVSGPFMPSIPIYSHIGIPEAEHSVFMRASVLERLLNVKENLPEGFGLLILDGHRTLQFQKKLKEYLEEQAGETLRDGYIANPKSTKVVPPHVTGGAIDLTLTFEDFPLSFGTDFDNFSTVSNLLYFEDVPNDGPIKNLVNRNARRFLVDLMTTAGFAPHPLEWWHWSYGDQWWAAYYKRSSSLYRAAEIR